MFNALKKRPGSSAPPPQSPNQAYEKAKRGAIDDRVSLKDRLMKSNWSVVILALVVAGLSWHIVNRDSLVVGYMLQEQQSGEVVAYRADTVHYVPTSNQKKYFIDQFLKRVFTLDASLTKTYIQEAYLLTDGTGTTELDNWYKRDRSAQRIKEAPDFVRNIKGRSQLNFVEDKDEGGVVIANVTTEEITKGSVAQPLAKRYSVTLHYSLIPPKNEDEIRRNPIGIYITHLAITEES